MLLSKAYAPEVQTAFIKKLMTPPPDATAEETANTHEELHKYTNLLLTAGRVVRTDNTQVDPTTPIADVLTNVSEGTMRFLPKPP